MNDAKTEIYFDGVKVSGVSGGGEIVFDLANDKISIPDSAIVNVISPEEVKLNFAAGRMLIKFNDGSLLTIEGTSDVIYQLADGSKYSVDHKNKDWIDRNRFLKKSGFGSEKWI